MVRIRSTVADGGIPFVRGPFWKPPPFVGFSECDVGQGQSQCGTPTEKNNLTTNCFVK